MVGRCNRQEEEDELRYVLHRFPIDDPSPLVAGHCVELRLLTHEPRGALATFNHNANVPLPGAAAGLPARMGCLIAKHIVLSVAKKLSETFR